MSYKMYQSKNFDLASKKGIAVTVAILIAITSASFVFWFLPQENEASFVVSDYENYLDGVINIRSVLENTLDEDFQKLENREISSKEYISIAEITSSQITGKISELVTSKPSEEWQQSYISYMDSLRQFNSQIRETIVYANLLEQGNFDELNATLDNIEDLRSKSRQLANESYTLRP